MQLERNLEGRGTAGIRPFTLHKEENINRKGFMI